MRGGGAGARAGGHETVMAGLLEYPPWRHRALKATGGGILWAVFQRSVSLVSEYPVACGLIAPLVGP